MIISFAGLMCIVGACLSIGAVIGMTAMAMLRVAGGDEEEFLGGMRRMARKLELVSDKCLLCGAQMIYDKYDFYKCPDCGGEFWLPDEKNDTEELMSKEGVKRTVSAFNAGETMGPGIKIPRKGNSKSGRRRKKIPKKPIYPYAKNYKEI